MSDPFDRILGQPQVRTFLRRVIKSGVIGQSYLFAGPVGSNKTAAAYAFAQSILCPKHGCGTCEICRKVVHHSHPDVKYFAPEGANGYLVSQIREIISDASLAPIQANHKIYIIDSADKLGVQGANAFLKTLEEPPADVVFILLGRTTASVLPTIVSRCQVVPFRHLSVEKAAGIVSQNSGADDLHARIAIQACGGSISHAIEFCRNADRFVFRNHVIETLNSIQNADGLAILDAARTLVEQAQAPIDLIRQSQNDEIEQSKAYMAKTQIKQMELRHKRVLSKRTSEALHQITSICRSWLRDVLVIKAHCEEQVTNSDILEILKKKSESVSVQGILAALSEPEKTDRAIAHNVSPETSIDALLFAIRKDLYGSNNARNA